MREGQGVGKENETYQILMLLNHGSISDLARGQRALMTPPSQGLRLDPEGRSMLVHGRSHLATQNVLCCIALYKESKVISQPRRAQYPCSPPQITHCLKHISGSCQLGSCLSRSLRNQRTDDSLMNKRGYLRG